MEEGPTRTDTPVTNARTTTNDVRTLRKCGCGWEKVTTLRGLHIHMGKMKCAGRSQKQTCAAQAGQTSGIQGRVKNHSAIGPNVAEAGEKETRDVDDPQEVTPEPPPSNPRTESSQKAKSLNEPRRKIKWPKASETVEWKRLDESLSDLLQKALRGTVEAKLNLFGEILYEECSGRYGKVTGRKAAEKSKGRREKEIDDLVAGRRQLRRRWRKAEESEREGLKALWDDIRRRLANLRRAERIRRRRKRKEKERANFFKNPFRFARGLLEEKTSGSLEISKEDLEDHIHGQYSDPARNEPLGPPGYVPKPGEPSVLFDASPPKLCEIKRVVWRARSASAPGPNGIPYKLYKNCPSVLKLLWTLMKTAWTKQTIPSQWQRAVAVFIPKEQNSKTIEQFRSIALLNVEGKIFFSVMARRMTSYLMENGYIDTSCQKAGIPGFPGCVEHATMIWEQIQIAKREKKDLHVVWLDLANAYGSVPHNLIAFALDFFYIPQSIRAMVMSYFQDLHMCFMLPNSTTIWQQLEVGIAMGCSISPILFITAFEVILIGARQVVGGARLPTGRKLPPLRSYMDDITCLLQTAPCTSRLMKRLDELIIWARMKFKAKKSRSLSLRKGVLNDRVTFIIGGENIPRIADQPIRSLGRQYTASLSDKEIGKTTLQQLSAGLAKIDSSQLPGKYKVWCFNFTLYPRVMWPLKLCEVTSSAVSKMDAKTSSFIRKWLGLPRGHSSASLYGKNTLQLPLKSITIGYRQEKARLVMELRESTDETVRDMEARVLTGRKWRAEEEVQKAVGRLQHQEMVGRVQTGRAGLGWGDPPILWSRASRKERKDLVVSEVTKMAEEEYRVKAVAQGQQGRWTTWEGVAGRVVSWADFWKLPQARLSFLIRATYDTLPSPRNLQQWLGTEQACDLCGTINASLQHTLSGCKTALSQGRYGWRHDQVLRKLAEVVERKRQEASAGRQPGSQQRTHFLREGEKGDTVRRRPASTLLLPGVEWRMEVDLGRQLHFPGEICSTTLRPDVVLWARTERSALLVELTVPWEEGMEGAHERKRAKYSDLVAECRESGWSTRLFPVEVGTRGFVGSSMTRLLKELGLRGKELHKATRELSEEAEKASFWLWLRRRDKAWGASNS